MKRTSIDQPFQIVLREMNDRSLQRARKLGGSHSVAGIAAQFEARDLVGRQVVLVANLKPAKIRGLESRGMILVAQSQGKMALVGPAEPIDAGAKIS